MTTPRLVAPVVLLVIATVLLSGCSSEPKETIPEPSRLDGLMFEGDQVLQSAADSLGVDLAAPPSVQRPSDLAAAMGDSIVAPLLKANISGQATARFEVGETGVAGQLRQFASIDDAFGYYAANRPDILDGVKFGSEGYRRGDSLVFSRDVYVATIYSESAADSSAIDSVARAIDMAIGGAVGLPTMFILFPFSGKVQSADQFTAYDYLGFPGVERVYSSKYVVGSDTVTLFLMQDPDKNKMAAMREGAERVASVSESPVLFSFEPGTGISFEHPERGAVVTGRVRGKVVGLISPGRDIGHRLFSRWVAGLQ